MKLKALGSSSSGNCYLLDDGKQILILEAGVPFSDVKEAIDYQTNRIVAVIYTHSHLDHSKYIYEYKDSCIPVIDGRTVEQFGRTILPPWRIGKFSISPFSVKHDVPCFGYQIEHPDMGKLIFVTDAEYCKYTFPGVNHIMVEANYAQDIIDENVNNGDIPKSLRDRIMKSHMSVDTAKGIVKANSNHMLRNVILLHLSSHNSDKKRFISEVSELAGPYCNVEAAYKGLEVNLDLYPF